MDGKRRLFIDIETYSSADIKKAGAFKYMEAPDFEILLIAYAWDTEPVQVSRHLPEEIRRALTDRRVVKVAHNSAFERAAFARVLKKDMPRSNGRTP